MNLSQDRLLNDNYSAVLRYIWNRLVDISSGHIFEIWKRLMERRLQGLQNKANV